jgi:hypothetical protein
MQPLSLLAQAAPNADPIQWTAPIPNDVAWWVQLPVIAVCTALITWGMVEKGARWHQQGLVSEKASMWAEALAVPFCMAVGGCVGYLTWHWGMGMLGGLVGSMASPWVIRLAGKLVDWRLGKKES